MPKYSIVWKGCRPTGELEVVSEPWMAKDEYYEKTACMGGVKEFKNLEELDEWWKNMSVSFGEEGGSFKIIGGWCGDFKDLKTGKSDFKSAKEIALEIDIEKEAKSEKVIQVERL